LRTGPAGTFARAYDANRQAAVEGLIEADPVAISVRRLMAQRASWAGTASDLLRVATYLIGDEVSKNSADWPKNPGILAGRLRRVQTFLRRLGIEISFSREGSAGTRTITITSAVDNRAVRVSAVSSTLTQTGALMICRVDGCKSQGAHSGARIRANARGGDCGVQEELLK